MSRLPEEARAILTFVGFAALIFLLAVASWIICAAAVIVGIVAIGTGAANPWTTVGVIGGIAGIICLTRIWVRA